MIKLLLLSVFIITAISSCGGLSNCDNCSTVLILGGSSYKKCDKCQIGYNIYENYCCSTNCSDCPYNSPDTCGQPCVKGKYYKADNRCRLCNITLASSCLDCLDKNTCEECDVGYYLQTNSSSVTDCFACSDHCLECQEFTVCDRCENLYELNESTFCVQVCGDQISVQYDCDLELGTQLDGCTDQCQVQSGFTCQNSNQTSTCSYSGSFTMDLVSMEKEMFANRMHLQFRISPVIYVLKKIDTAALFSFNDTDFQKPAIDFDESSGLITIEFTYPEDIEGRKFMFNFLPSQSTDPRFFATSDQSWVYTLTSGQSLLPAIYYTNDEYTYSQFLYFFGFVLVALAFLICIAGIFSPHKLAGLEVMFVVQYAFVCMTLLEGFLPLPIYCFRNIQYSIGVNYHYDVSTTGTPAQAEMFSLSQLYFSSNMNYFGITYCLAFISFVVIKIINCCSDKTDKEKKEKLERVSEFIHQLAMYTLMFNLTYLTFCLALFFSHGQLTDLSSEILIALFLLYNVGILICFFFKPVDFYRFRLIFKATELTFNHYYFHVICIVSGTALVVLLPDYPWSPFIPQGLLFFYTLINRPYQFIKENLRSGFNLLVMCATTSMIVFYHYDNNKIAKEWKNYIYPGVIQVLIFLAIFWAYYNIIRDFVNQYVLEQKKKRNLAYEFFNEQQTIRRVEEMVLNSNAFRPVDILNSFVLRENQSPDQRSISHQQRQEEFFSSIQLTPEEEQFLETLKKQKFSSKKQAVKLMRTELDFIRYQRAKADSERFKGEIDKKKLQMFDAI